MTFENAITEIMPLVNDGDKSTPFIISRRNSGWVVNYPYPAETAQTYLSDIRKDDPCAVSFIGSDFAKGSYPNVYDKIITARLRAEYDTLQYGAATLLELNAVVNFFEDNLCELSPEVASYMMTLDRPLYEMNEIKPFALFNAQSEYGYDEDKVMDFISLLENHVEKATPELKAGDFIDYDNKRWHVDSVDKNSIKLTNINPLDNTHEIRATRWKDHIQGYTLVDKSEVDMSTLIPRKPLSTQNKDVRNVEHSNPKNDNNSTKIWLRLGISLDVSDSQGLKIKNGDEKALLDVLTAPGKDNGGWSIDGDTYIPDTIFGEEVNFELPKISMSGLIQDKAAHQEKETEKQPKKRSLAERVEQGKEKIREADKNKGKPDKPKKQNKGVDD